MASHFILRQKIRTPSWLVIALIAFVSSARVASALYEDQAGVTDWQRENIGQVNHAVFYSSGQHKWAYVGTKAGVVAAINLRNGSTVWRQVLPDSRPVTHLVHIGSYIVTVSARDHLHIWRAPDGALLWDQRLPNEVVDVLFNDQGLFVLSKDAVMAFSVPQGKQLWKWSAESDTTPRAELELRHMFGTASELSIIGLSRQADKQMGVHTMVLDVSTGKEAKPAFQALFASGSADLPASVLTSDSTSLVMVDEEQCDVTSLLIKEGDITSKAMSSLQNSKGTPMSASSGCSLVDQPLPSAAQVVVGDQTLLLRVSAAGVEVEQDCADKACRAASATDKSGVEWISLIKTSSAETSTHMLPLTPPTEEHADLSYPITLDTNGPPVSAFMHFYSRKDGSTGSRLLLVNKDHSLHLLQGGKLVWSREEALASPTESQFVPFPPPPVVSIEGASTPSFSFMVPEMVSTVMEAATSFMEPEDEITEESVLGKPLVADSFGFEQLVVVMTDAGKVFALHTVKGFVVWKHFFHEGTHSSNPNRLLGLHLTRPATVPHPCITVVGEASTGDSTQLFVASLSIFDGKQLALQRLPEGIGLLYSTMLPVTDADGNHPLILVDDNLDVHLFPETEAARASFNTYRKEIFFAHYHPQSFSFRGYSISAAPKAVESWSFLLSGPSEQVVVASTRQQETLGSPVKSLGDKSVLYKYLNPNLLAVSTLVGAGKESSVQLYLLDVVTGALVHHAHHPHCNGPVRLSHADNFLLYHYWNSRRQRFQVTMLELYQNQTQKPLLEIFLEGPEDPLSEEHKWDSAVAGTTANPLMHTLTASFVFPTAVTSIATTSTANGLSTKQILFGLQSDQVLFMDKRVFDPRRPKATPTPADKEEGLIQYNPSVGPINHMQMLSHTRSVKRMSSIKTAATNLESTSLVFAFGLDLFFTRTAPAGTFDQLDDDFNHVALLLATIALLVGTILSCYVARQKDLQRLWQ